MAEIRVRVGGESHILTGDFMTMVEVVKSCDNRSYDPVTKEWTVFPSPANVERLRPYNGAIRILDLTEQAKMVKEKCPYLYPFQASGVAELLYNGKVLLGDHVGNGKSVMAIAWASMLSECPHKIITCPATLKEQWAEEVKKFIVSNVMILEGSKKQRREIYRKFIIKGGFLIGSYETMRQDVEEIKQIPPPFAIIEDEVHRLKNKKSKTYKAFKEIRASRIIGLSATPFTNYPNELFAVMEHLNPGWMRWGEFSEKYCLWGERWTGKDIVRIIIGYKNLLELNDKIRPFMVRRSREEVAQDLPPKTFKNVICELGKEQKRLHDHYKKVLIEGDAGQALVGFMMARMASNSTDLIKLSESEMKIPVNGSESGKIEKLGELIDGIEGKIVVFTQWKRMANLVHKSVPNSLLVTGDTVDKHSVITTFKESDLRILIATDCINAGINLDCATTVINVDLPFTEVRLQQRNGRIDRLTQTKPMMFINLISENSIEWRVWKILQRKKASFDASIDGDDEAAKKIVEELKREWKKEVSAECD